MGDIIIIKPNIIPDPTALHPPLCSPEVCPHVMPFQGPRVQDGKGLRPFRVQSLRVQGSRITSFRISDT